MLDAQTLALAGVAASGFLSATILPGNSEIALAAYLSQWPQGWAWALVVASLANSAGSATSLWLGRVAPRKELPPRAARWLTRWGPAALLLSWLPVVGDALPLAAGWLRLPTLPCLLWITVGKSARYALLAAGVLALY